MTLEELRIKDNRLTRCMKIVFMLLVVINVFIEYYALHGKYTEFDVIVSNESAGISFNLRDSPKIKMSNNYGEFWDSHLLTYDVSKDLVEEKESYPIQGDNYAHRITSYKPDESFFSRLGLYRLVVLRAKETYKILRIQRYLNWTMGLLLAFLIYQYSRVQRAIEDGYRESLRLQIAEQERLRAS